MTSIRAAGKKDINKDTLWGDVMIDVAAAAVELIDFDVAFVAVVLDESTEGVVELLPVDEIVRHNIDAATHTNIGANRMVTSLPMTLTRLYKIDWTIESSFRKNPCVYSYHLTATEEQKYYREYVVIAMTSLPPTMINSIIGWFLK